MDITMGVVIMEVSSVFPKVLPPGNLGRGWFFFLRNPLPSGTNYCLISLGVGVGQWVGALFMQRFWFYLSKMVACLSNWLKKKYGGNAGGLSENVLWLCLLLADISGSLKILDNIGVILSTKVRKKIMLILLLAFHLLQALGAAKSFISLITK